MRSLFLGRPFGIPLFIHWSFLLLCLLVTFLTRAGGPVGMLFGEVVLVSLFVCVVLHELGHALMARAFGIRTRDITLYPIGGVARLESTGHTPFQEVCIALAGPAVNLVLVFLFVPFVVAGVLLGGQPLSVEAMAGDVSPQALVFNYLLQMCVSNGILMVFNLIPAFPMDGGRVLRALLTIRLGLVRATGVAATIGLVVAVGLAIFGMTWGGSPMLVLVSGFVIFAGQAEFHGLRRLEAARQRRRQSLLEVPPAEVLVRAGNPLDPSLPLRPVGTTVQATDRSGCVEYLWDPERKVWVYWVDGRREDLF